jgi:hypothetical protein
MINLAEERPKEAKRRWIGVARSLRSPIVNSFTASFAGMTR